MNQSKRENWTREYKGEEVIVHKSAITPLQRKEERVSHSLLNKAKRIEKLLKELLEYGNNAIDGVYLTKLNEGRHTGKTTFEFSSFDGSVMIKKDMRKRYLIEPGLIVEAGNMLQDWADSSVVNESIKEKIKNIRELPVDNGVITTTAFVEIFALRSIYKDADLEKALDKLTEGIVKETSDPYFRVYEEVFVKTDDEEELKEMKLINTSMSKI